MTDKEILDALESNKWSVIAPVGRFTPWKVGLYGSEDLQMASAHSLRGAVRLLVARRGSDELGASRSKLRSQMIGKKDLLTWLLDCRVLHEEQRGFFQYLLDGVEGDLSND